jgi:hypothetical protein
VPPSCSLTIALAWLDGQVVFGAVTQVCLLLWMRRQVWEVLWYGAVGRWVGRWCGGTAVHTSLGLTA